MVSSAVNATNQHRIFRSSQVIFQAAINASTNRTALPARSAMFSMAGAWFAIRLCVDFLRAFVTKALGTVAKHALGHFPAQAGIRNAHTVFQ